jgi:hypothetical protein
MKGSVERNIVANLGRRYRWALDAYFLVLYNEKSTSLLISLAICKVDERWNAFETSRKILKGEKECEEYHAINNPFGDEDE